MPEFAQPAWLVLIAALALLIVLAGRSAGRARARRVTAGILRTLALAALAVALAGPLAGSGTRHIDVVFALDLSSSIARESVAEALDFVNRARESPAARIGLVVFGADASVESLVRGGSEPSREITAHVERAGTDIGRAIEVAIGAFPGGAHRRIVLLSDGRENLGDARSAAAVARSLGVEIDTVALERSSARKEVYVQGMTVPPRVRLHEPFTVQTEVRSSESARAHLVIMRNGVLLREFPVELVPGVNVYSLVEQADTAGLQEYEVIINSDADSEPANNRYQAFVHVSGAPKVLHVVDGPEAGRYVSAALRAQGLTVDEVPASALPANLHELVDYDLVILDNVSGLDLSLAKMALLEYYVRDAGGGVVMIGGDRSYGAGAYHGTPVERLLPVTMDVKTEIMIPSLSVVFVLDRSGSMGTKAQDEEKLTIAKRAALASIDLLKPLDRVGVLAFDSSRDWVVPMTEAGVRRPIAERLRDLTVGGGTDLHPALEEAHRVLRKEQAKVKHLIVLSDGLTEGEKNFDPLAARIAADGITVSTVAMGADADRSLMARLATLGKGRYYHADDPRNVPRIFTSETMTITRDLVVEGNIRPRRTYAGEPIAGFGADAFPVLGGYQRTHPKPAAQILLAGRGDDPLLVSWRYGLGKAVAFTSDLSGRWGRQWVQWPAFGRFVSQTARWTMRRNVTGSFVPHFQWRGQRGEMSVDVLDRDDRFINGLKLGASLVDPSRLSRRVELEQIAPGRYHGEFPAPRAGRYTITLTGRDGELQVGPTTFGLAVPYSSEFLDLGVDQRLLRDIASITGGRLLPLSSAGLSAVTAPSPQASSPLSRVWWPFLLAALLLIVAEVAARRVTLPEAWRARWARWRGAGGGTEEPEPEYSALSAAIARERTRHLAAMRDGIYLNADEPAARARLYLSAGRSRAR
ncbi:MAG TPA: VWA domain-containing protein [Burkholderiales bacterium]|nr:VWA domain-containing protein [Burkholderiales bacterium]